MRVRLTGLVLVLTLVMTAMALAQSGGDFDLSWWTIDGGGGRLTGSGFTLESSVGQPDASTLQGGEYVLYGGFWSPSASATPAPTPTPGCPDPYEPNDDFSQAGPITPGTTIQAYICTEGEQDFYKFNVTTGQTILVTLTNIPSGHDYDLFLDGPSQTDVASSTQSGNVDEQITYTATTGGTYYAIVNGYSGHSTTEAYRLRVTLSGGNSQRNYLPTLQK